MNTPMNNAFAALALLVASTSFACNDDPSDELSSYAADPIACTQDSDCCVVADGCRATVYVVAAKDSAKASSIVASADNSQCFRCVTPRVQTRCASGVCASERIDFSCPFPTPYPGDHCGALDVPDSCLSSTKADAGANLANGATARPLAVYKCGG
jgi:hypothetical protein